jgi:hypothetical protein
MPVFGANLSGCEAAYATHFPLLQLLERLGRAPANLHRKERSFGEEDCYELLHCAAGRRRRDITCHIRASTRPGHGRDNSVLGKPLVRPVRLEEV